MARRSIFLFMAGLLALAGCVGAPTKNPPPPPPPPPATQICGQNFSSAGNYQISFYNLGHANTGFVTADGFAPVGLPDGRTAWWMSDTVTGTSNPDNTVSNQGGVHNSVVLQGGGCLTPQFGNPEMAPGSGGTWLWPGSSVVSGNTMLVFSYIVSSTGSGPFDFAVSGTRVALYSLPSLQLVSGPVDLPHTPAPNGGGDIPWGIRSFVSGSTVYLYGSTRHNVDFLGVQIPVEEAWLARAPFSNPTQLEYFTNPLVGSAWSTNFANAKPMTFTKNGAPDSSPLAQLSVVPTGGKYVASAFAADVFQDNQGQSFVWAWEADNPQGPWRMVTNGTDPRIIATFQKRSPDQFAYDARTMLLTDAGWTVVFSANDPYRLGSDWTLYRGEFRSPNGFPP
jgi:hypothetical protein